MTQATRASVRSHPVQLRRVLWSRLLPVAALVTLVVSLSAPLAFMMLEQRSLQQQATYHSQQIARLLQREVRLRPLLWRYDTMKIVQHVKHVRQLQGSKALLGIEIVDHRGRWLAMKSSHTKAFYQRHEAVWAHTSLRLRGQRVGAVWVAMGLRSLRHQTIAIFAVFLVLGSLLGCFVLWLPMRTMSVAESEILVLIEELERASLSLSTLNVSLEQQVNERSQALQEALAEVRQQEQELRSLAARATSLQAEERRHIARELHDSAGQALTATHIHLQLVCQQLTVDSPALPLVEQAIAMSEATLEEIRRAVMLLGPSVLDDFGLGVALKRACEDFQERSGVSVSYVQSSPLEGLPKGVESMCYRIVQEALTNIARHAAASHVEICVSEESVGASDGVESTRIAVSIVDDGCGFALELWEEQKKRSTSRGLRGMRERAALSGGSFALRSSPDNGTRIDFAIPCELAYSDHERR